MEAGITINIKDNQKETFEYLKKYFPTNYVVNKKHTKQANVSISHSEPFVKIGSEVRPLLFPDSVFKSCENKWKENRDIDFLFVGLITQKRELALKSFTNLLKTTAPNAKLVVEHSTKGRTFPIKSWDSDYYDLLSRAKFVICLNGDFIWTYRFFESILCGAIPIIEDKCDIYNEFNFFKLTSSEFNFDQNITHTNLQKAKKLLTLSPEVIKEQICNTQNLPS